MKPITTRGPAQVGTRNGSPGERREGTEITGALLAAASRPDPEVAEKPQRRRFTAEYKVRILREADAGAEPGAIGALLRREGLYSSHLTEWRRQREQGALAGLAPKKRGRRGAPPHPLARRVSELERENTRLQRRLQQAEAIIEVQKKVSELLGIPLNPPGSDERA
jgi:transposase-like protein